MNADIVQGLGDADALILLECHPRRLLTVPERDVVDVDRVFLDPGGICLRGEVHGRDPPLFRKVGSCQGLVTCGRHG